MKPTIKTSHEITFEDRPKECDAGNIEYIPEQFKEKRGINK